MTSRFGGEYPRPPQNILTPELAVDDPEAYKDRLLGVLENGTILGGAMWEHLCEKKICSRTRLIIDPNDGGGSSKDGIITLGAQSWSEQEMQELTHSTKNFMGDKQFMYRLGHEISHIMFTDFHHQPSTNLYNKTLIPIRLAVSSKGFSWLGHHSHYEQTGPQEQAKEDLTELINKFIIDPNYLMDFLRALSSDSDYYKKFRKQMNLVAITPDSAENVYNIIEDCVRQRLHT